MDYTDLYFSIAIALASGLAVAFIPLYSTLRGWYIANQEWQEHLARKDKINDLIQGTKQIEKTTDSFFNQDDSEEIYKIIEQGSIPEYQEIIDSLTNARKAIDDAEATFLGELKKFDSFYKFVKGTTTTTATTSTSTTSSSSGTDHIAWTKQKLQSRQVAIADFNRKLAERNISIKDLNSKLPGDRYKIIDSICRELGK